MTPLFSVIIPTHDRAKSLFDALASLSNQTYPNVEVVVVNDRGPDVSNIIQAFEDDPMTVRLVNQYFGSPGSARNLGVDFARGEWIAFTDDDCRFHPDWLLVLSRHLERRPQIYGGTTYDITRNPWSFASQVFVDFLIDWYGDDYFPTCNLAMTKAAFHAVGPMTDWDTTYDREWCWRANKVGVGMEFVPAAIAYHNRGRGRMGFHDFWRQHVKYGRGSAVFYDHTGEPLMPLRFYGQQLLYPLKHKGLSPLVKVVTTALMALSRVAHTGGYLRERHSHR